MFGAFKNELEYSHVSWCVFTDEQRNGAVVMGKPHHSACLSHLHILPSAARHIGENGETLQFLGRWNLLKMASVGKSLKDMKLKTQHWFYWFLKSGYSGNISARILKSGNASPALLLVVSLSKLVINKVVIFRIFCEIHLDVNIQYWLAQR